MRPLVVLGFCLLFAPAAAGDEKLDTVESLWAGFDPRKEPLEIEIVKAWDEGDIHLETVYFTGETFEGVKIRIFGYWGRPRESSGKIPAVLHIHGGGQTAVLDWPRFWAKRGYACLSFDFCGDTSDPKLGKGYQREHFTKWGKVPADMMKVGGGLSMKPTPRHNPWYHWTLAARRGLTFLETRPGVDGDRLGIFGISVGGTLTWGVAAVDHRVKAAAPIYGGGWEYYPYPPDEKAPVGDDLKLWRTLIAPETLAPRVRCPLLLLSATNDGHGRMDLAMRTLDRLGSPIKTAVFTPNYDHHVEPDEGRSLPLFMDAMLKSSDAKWPTTPPIDIVVDILAPRIRVSPADWDNVERVDVFYNLSNPYPTTRFWRMSKAVRDGDFFFAVAPFIDPGDTITAFANVTWKSGVRISTRLDIQSVSDLKDARPTLKWKPLIDSMETSEAWSWVPAYTDPCREDRFFKPWKGPGGEIGFTLDPKTFGYGGAMPYYFGTRKIGDPQFRGKGTGGLKIDHWAESTPEKLRVHLTARKPGETPVIYSAVIGAAVSEGKWKTWTMTPGEFRNAADHKLGEWDHVEHFVLEGVNPANRPPVFRDLRWE